jgi:hypothetical protein
MKAVYLHAETMPVVMDMINMRATIDAKDGRTDLLVDILGVAE